MKSVRNSHLWIMVAVLGLSALAGCASKKQPATYQAPALVPASSVQAAPLAAPAQPAARTASQVSPYSK